MSERKDEQSILSELSVAQAFKHIEWFANRCPQRLSGTEEARLATDYIIRTLHEYGLSETKHEFDAFVCVPKNPDWSGILEVRSPVKANLKCVVRAQIASTPPEGIEGEVVYMRSGFESDYAGVDVKGKITLVDVGGVALVGDQKRRISRYEQYRFARERWAIAQIQIGYGDVLQLGSVKDSWGNPTPQAMRELPSMPAVGISSKDGELLAELCKRGVVRLWMKAEMWRGWTRVFEPVTRVEGTRWPEQHLLVGAHMDAWGGGVTCNATGISLLLELARVFHRHKNSLKRTLKLAWWPGHETGTFAGSMWYVDNHWQDIKDNMIVYINCDSPGLSQTSAHRSIGTLEVRNFQDDVLADMEIESKGRKIVRRRPACFGDFPCFLYGPGIPVMYDRGDYHANKDWWWYHSAADTLEKADRDVFLQELRLYAAYVFRLLNAEILPFKFAGVARDMLKCLTDLQEKGVIDLNDQVKRAREFAEGSSRLDQQISRLLTNPIEERTTEINTLLMKLSRAINNVIYSSSGRYEHDPYSVAEILIPGLYAINEVAGMDSDSDEHKAVNTLITRQKNRLSDALDEASEIVVNAIKASTQ
jgi:Peptidase family M28